VPGGVVSGAPGRGRRAHEPATAGERWARSELERLRARRFSPAAVVAFLDASCRRSAEVRTTRPRLARQARRWELFGALTWALLAAGRREPFCRRLRSGLCWWAACALMLEWHLGMMETEGGEPLALSAADALTLMRAWLVPVAADGPDPLVCATAAITDIFDGVWARRRGSTRAGRDLEGLVDACFGLAALRGARRRGMLGALPARAEGLRLLTGIALATLIYFGRARAPDPALARAARATTALRAGGLIVAGTGRRQIADVAVTSGSALSIALAVIAVGRARRAR